MRIGWIADEPAYLGGAELTQMEFKAAVPDGVEIVDCPPGKVEAGLDRYVAHNVTQFALADFTRAKSLIWFHHDLSPWVNPDVRFMLDQRDHIFCSPLQRERYGLGDDWPTIPPQLDLDRYRPTRQIQRNRKGSCSIAAWRNPGKGAQALADWAAEHGPVDIYGDGSFAPHGYQLENKGPLEPEQVAQTLLNYKTFVFLPFDVEPFCRCVVEAWASGCELIVNGNIGATYYLTEKPEALDTAAADFWKAILD